MRWRSWRQTWVDGKILYVICSQKAGEYTPRRNKDGMAFCVFWRCYEVLLLRWSFVFNVCRRGTIKAKIQQAARIWMVRLVLWMWNCLQTWRVQYKIDEWFWYLCLFRMGRRWAICYCGGFMLLFDGLKLKSGVSWWFFYFFLKYAYVFLVLNIAFFRVIVIFGIKSYFLRCFPP